MARSAMRSVRAAALALALAACAADGGRPAATAPATAEPAAAQPAALEPAIAKPAEPEAPLAPETAAVIEMSIAVLTAAAPSEAAAEPAVPEPAPAPPIDDDPARVMNLADAALEALLGMPGFTRAEADAQVWQYRGRDCVLDVYLYSDGLAGPYRVAYFEIRDGASGETATGDDARRRCFGVLLRARAAG